MAPQHRIQSPPRSLQYLTTPGETVYLSLVDVCGKDNVKHHVNYDVGGLPDLPVELDEDVVFSASSVSDVLQQNMPLSFDSVFVAPEMAGHAHRYLKVNTRRILEGSSV